MTWQRSAFSVDPLLIYLFPLTERDKFTRAALDGQRGSSAPGAVTALHFTGGAADPHLYVVTEKQTSIIDLRTNAKVRRCISSAASESRRRLGCYADASVWCAYQARAWFSLRRETLCCVTAGATMLETKSGVDSG